MFRAVHPSAGTGRGNPYRSAALGIALVSTIRREARSSFSPLACREEPRPWWIRKRPARQDSYASTRGHLKRSVAESLPKTPELAGRFSELATHAVDEIRANLGAGRPPDPPIGPPPHGWGSRCVGARNLARRNRCGRRSALASACVDEAAIIGLSETNEEELSKCHAQERVQRREQPRVHPPRVAGRQLARSWCVLSVGRSSLVRLRWVRIARGRTELPARPPMRRLAVEPVRVGVVRRLRLA